MGFGKAQEKTKRDRLTYHLTVGVGLASHSTNILTSFPPSLAHASLSGVTKSGGARTDSTPSVFAVPLELESWTRSSGDYQKRMMQTCSFSTGKMCASGMSVYHSVNDSKTVDTCMLTATNIGDIKKKEG